MVKIVSQHLEAVIKARIPSIQALINKTIDELETEMNLLGKPIAVDGGVSFFFTLLLTSGFPCVPF